MERLFWASHRPLHENSSSGNAADPLQNSPVFAPAAFLSVTVCSKDVTGGFPGDGFSGKEKGQACTGAEQRPRDSSRQKWHVLASLCCRQVPWQLVPECWRETSVMLRCPSPLLLGNTSSAEAENTVYGPMQPDDLGIRKANILLCISTPFFFFLNDSILGWQWKRK